jgi:hypothetical protein
MILLAFRHGCRAIDGELRHPSSMVANMTLAPVRAGQRRKADDHETAVFIFAGSSILVAVLIWHTHRLTGRRLGKIENGLDRLHQCTTRRCC